MSWTFRALKWMEKRLVFSCDLKLYRDSLAERKWETIPDDRASVRKKALPLECFASDRIAEDEWRDREGCTAEDNLQNIEAQNLR